MASEPRGGDAPFYLPPDQQHTIVDSAQDSIRVTLVKTLQPERRMQGHRMVRLLGKLPAQREDAKEWCPRQDLNLYDVTH